MKNNFTIDIVNKDIIKKFLCTDNSLLITGKVWTGKTELMKLLLDLSPKKSIALSPNNFEAVKSGTVSIKSFLKIPHNVEDYNLDFINEVKYSPEYINFIQELDLIAIDEVTFLSSQMLDILNLILQKIRRNSKTLGGIQLILAGDLCETLPFLKEKELKVINKQWESEYFFDAKCYNSLTMEYFDLGGIYNKDLHFDIENLYFLIGNNNIQSGYLDYLNRLFVYKNDDEIDKLILTIDTPFADSINKENLENLLNVERYVFECDVFGEFDINASPVEPLIDLRMGAKVILLKNDLIDADYENGATGIFDGLEDEKICILIDDKRVLVKKTEWVNYEYCFDVDSNEFKKVQKGIFIQYPIKLGWAISIKDSKGMAFKKLHFQNKDVQILGNSQAYSVYCRTSNNCDSSISIPFRRNDIKSDKRVMDFLFRIVYKEKYIFEETHIE